MNRKKLWTRTSYAVLSAAIGLSPVISPLMSAPVYAQEETPETSAAFAPVTLHADDVTVEKKDGDNIVPLPQLGNARSFTYSADVLFNDYEEGQQSAALVFGGIYANVHGKIDWNNPARVWGNAIEAVCPGEKGQDNTWFAENGIDLSQKFHLSVTVDESGLITYSINGKTAVTTTVNDAYSGGTFGLMTFGSSASFSNITLVNNDQPDRSELDLLLESCKGLNAEDYTEESWNALQAAIENAVSAGTQEEIDAAVSSIAQAKDALKKADEKQDPEEIRNRLQALAEKAEGLREEDYEEGFEELSPAIKEAKAVLENKEASVKELQSALDSLQSAVDALVKKKVPAESGDFRNVGSAKMEIEDGALVLYPSGDHFAMLDSQKTPANDFYFEADVKLLEGSGNEMDKMSAALVFGASSKKTPGAKWYGANVDTRRMGSDDLFRVFGAGSDILSGGDASDIDLTSPIHLAIDVKSDGSFVYSFGNPGSTLHQTKGKISSWSGGYVGLLTFNAKAAFSNVYFEDRSVPAENKVLENDDRWNSGLQESENNIKGGDWSITDEGLVSDAFGKGDTFLISKMEGKDFIYETDLSFQENTGAAGLIFRYSEGEYGKEGYAVNLDAESHKAKFWRWQEDQVLQLIDEVQVKEADSYHLRVTAIGGSIQYWINDVLIANLGDHTMQVEDRGQSTIVTEGSYGLINWNAKAVFQNTQFTVLDEKNTPSVTDVTVGSHTGTVQEKGQFFPESPTWIQFVEDDAKSVYIHADVNKGTEVSYEYGGNSYKQDEDIPVETGNNIVTMTLKNGEAERTYRLNIHRFGPDNEYYNEPYRGQYHYSVKEGWLNDPCGLVYYKGKYHMFYQYYSENTWGPMHWMHAVSTDRIHWEEQPVALYPDYNGTMFSGCMAVDETNASGLFSSDEGGLIAYITSNGNGQRIKMAISEDEGKTWKKIDQIAADWKDDPLGSMDFRDPKVFQWENKWFMVVAGGPLRIYSSDDMVSWKPEAVYGDLHTECPDLYPQEIKGQIKWILSRGGRYYKVGDLKQVDGTWTFVPDEYYQDKDGVMNFGHDSYAAMSYYVQNFGTLEKPNIPEIVTQNWMNTWDDYCRVVGESVGQKFNGTYNLALKIGLTEDENGVYRLTQTPLSSYNDLRKDEIRAASGIQIAEGNDLLSDFQATSYEIVSKFTPSEGTKKVGFKVRTGDNGDETLVVYDVENDIISIDRSHSGVQISGKFSETKSQDLSDMKTSAKAARNSDGSIDLHLYVDSASIEVFANNYTVAGANQIFPSPASRGASVIVEGEPVTADITIYTLDSIWTKSGEASKSIQSSDARNQIIYTGKSRKLSAYVYPVENSQELNWSSDNPETAAVDEKGNVTALKAGKAMITASSAAFPELSLQFEIEVRDDNFNTNVSGWISDGDWIIDNDELVNEDHCNNHYTLSSENYQGDWTVSTDVKYEKGLVNIFYASDATPFVNQAYGVQLGSGPSIKLFRFGGPDDASATLPAALNDGAWHNIQVVKKGKTVAVLVDGAEVLSHTFEQTASHFENGKAGLGLWDGKASFKNFRVIQETDRSALNEAIENCGSLNKEDYTEESWAVFEAALNEAKAVSENETASQNEIDLAVRNLNQAAESLEKKAPVVIKADKTALIAEIEESEKLNPNDYTDETAEPFVSALNKAKEVSENEDASQEEVDRALNNLSQSRKDLKKKSSNPKPDSIFKQIKKAIKKAVNTIVSAIKKLFPWL